MQRPRVRGLLRWLAIFWLAMLALQIWDSRNGSGASGVTEFVSAVLGINITAITGVASNGDGTLRLTLSDGGHARVSRRRAAEVRTRLASGGR